MPHLWIRYIVLVLDELSGHQAGSIRKQGQIDRVVVGLHSRCDGRLGAHASTVCEVDHLSLEVLIASELLKRDVQACSDMFASAGKRERKCQRVRTTLAQLRRWRRDEKRDEVDQERIGSVCSVSPAGASAASPTASSVCIRRHAKVGRTNGLFVTDVPAADAISVPQVDAKV